MHVCQKKVSKGISRRSAEEAIEFKFLQLCVRTVDLCVRFCGGISRGGPGEEAAAV